MSTRSLCVLVSLSLTLLASWSCTDSEPQTNPDLNAKGGASSQGGNANRGGATDGGGGAGGTGDDAPYDCFQNPKTHFEIINACTSSLRVEKAVSLPPLPK